MQNTKSMTTELSVEDLIKEYPRQQGMNYLRTMWQSGAMPIDPATGEPVTLERLLDGFRAYRNYCIQEGIELRFIRKVQTYIAEFGWLDTYELPKAPVQSPHESEMARLTSLADKWWPRGVAVTKFVLDWRRDRISEADKRAIVQCGIRTAEEVAA